MKFTSPSIGIFHHSLRFGDTCKMEKDKILFLISLMGYLTKYHTNARLYLAASTMKNMLIRYIVVFCLSGFQPALVLNTF